MPIIFKMDFKNLKKNVLKDAVSIVSDTTSLVYTDVRQFSPIDTGKYVSGHKNKGIRIDRDRVIGEIENVGAYSERVEQGFRKAPVNWNLQNIGQIYNSVGANVYAKSLAKNKDLFIRKLSGQ